MGFKHGAVEVLQHSQYPIEKPLFLVDDLDCRGNETSIRDCSFSGWGKHDCTAQEVFTLFGVALPVKITFAAKIFQIIAPPSPLHAFMYVKIILKKFFSKDCWRSLQSFRNRMP